MNYAHDTDAALRLNFTKARLKGKRAKDAAESLGVTEGVALLAHRAQSWQPLESLPVSTPLAVYALKPQWVDLLKSLEVCGPLLALTRNEGVVHEKTGVYAKIGGSDKVGLVLGSDIDLRLFLDQWAGGFLVIEPGPASDRQPKLSLQFFDARGQAVHKIFAVADSQLPQWQQVVSSWVDLAHRPVFDPSLPLPAKRQDQVADVPALLQDWASMDDPHDFFGLLKRHNVERLAAFEAVQGQFARRVAPSAVLESLYQASFSGTPIMVFVGNPGCIQIHTGCVHRIEPMDIHGNKWINVLDPGFNLHLREDLIAQCWVVEKPSSDGPVSSLEVFDAQGQTMFMLFGARKPGQAQLQAWSDVLTALPSWQAEVATA